MDNNQLYIKRLKEVLWNKQKDLKKVVSHEFCPTCQEYVLTSNYCQQCGQMNLSTDAITYHESQSFIDNRQYYMVQSNRWLDRWGLWLEEQLNKVGLQINQGTLFNLGRLHKGITIIFSVLSVYFSLLGISSLYNLFSVILFLFWVFLSLFTNYQLYSGQSNKVLIGVIGFLLESVMLSMFYGSSLGIIYILIFFVLPLTLLLMIRPSVAQRFRTPSFQENKEAFSVPSGEIFNNVESKKVSTPKLTTSVIGTTISILVKLAILGGIILAVMFYVENSADGKYRMGYDGVADIELNIMFTMVSGEIEVMGQTQSFRGSINLFDKTIHIDLPKEIPGVGSEISGTYEKDEYGNLKVEYFTFKRE